jgi:hypothetical protein
MTQELALGGRKPFRDANQVTIRGLAACLLCVLVWDLAWQLQLGELLFQRPAQRSMPVHLVR